MSVDILRRTDWSRQINQTTVKRTGVRKTIRQLAIQKTGARERMKKKNGLKKVGDGETPVWHELLHCFLLLENWSVNRMESSNNPASSVTAVVLWSSGSEKDGLVHFYCLANAPNSPVCSSIIHSILLFLSKLPPRPLFSPSKFSLSLSHSFLLSVFHCRSSAPRSTSWDTLKINGHGSSHRIMS